MRSSAMLTCAVFMLFAGITLTVKGQKTTKEINELRTKILQDPAIKSVDFDEHRQTPSFVVMNAGSVSYTTAETINVLHRIFSTRKGTDNFIEEKRTRLSNDATVLEIQQYYKNIKVDRARIKAYLQDDALKLLNGNFYAIPDGTVVTPAIDGTKAMEFAKKKINASKYADEEIKDRMAGYKDASVLAVLNKELQEATAKPELVFVEDFTVKGTAIVKLAYKINVYAAIPISRSWVYVDAADGKILLVDAIIKHVNTAAPTSSIATVQTRYAGTRNIYVKQISGNDPQNGLPLISSHPASEVYVPGSSTWVLIDDTRGNGIETYDLNGVGGLPISVPPAYTAAKSFTDVNNQWTLAEHKRSPVEEGAAEAENDDIAWDAHWGAEVVYDYWKAKHNRLSFDGKDAKIKSFIHSGVLYDNAFWNGTVMTYGDGSGTAAMGFKALTSLDVCGHEIGHGVCSNTSDLVYANESGAMNEGLSDIWAACIEYFAIKNIDPALALKYKPFYIGEQIAASPAAPLRRMDNPIAQSNPDTYGGRNWTTTTGCTPTLVNDECGVHNNSGVINKWFYLITAGSGAGSGPDAAFAGEDDGVNDAVITGPAELQHPANPYEVTGLGFAVAEQVVFIMETMLSSTATYAEARQVSIAVATELSGSSCSAMVESVTNAWYAVGVGAKFTKPCIVVYGFTGTTGSSVTETAVINGCASTKLLNIPVLLPANSTASVALSGTAIRNEDYFISTAPLTNATGAVAKKTLAVTVINDGTTEPDEFLQLTLTITNTGGNTSNRTYRLDIIDDDVVPVIGAGPKTLMSQYFTRGDGFNELTGWVEKLELPEAPNGDPVATGKNQWGIFNNQLAITGREGLTGTQLPRATYNSLSESQTIVRTPLIDARGMSIVNVKFSFNVQGEVDPATTDPETFPALDYMALAYSLDGINFIELNTGDWKQFASLLPATGTVDANLPAGLANKQFYLGFRWHNDANAGGPTSVSIDNLVVSGTPRRIENQLGHNSRNIISAGNDIYFLSVQDGEVLARIKNNATVAPGCTNIYIERTGNSSFNLYSNGSTVIKTTGKVFRINPAVNSSINSSISLYYSEAQLAALETATGKNRSTFNLYFTDATAYTTASAANTVQYTAVYTALAGVGGYYTYSGTAKFGGSWSLGTTSSNLPRPAATQDKNITRQWSFFNAKPNPVRDALTISLTTPSQQRIKIVILNAKGQSVQLKQQDLNAGYNSIRLNIQQLVAGSYWIQLQDAAGKILHTESIIKD